MTLTTPYSATFIVGDGETKTFSYLFEEVSPNFISVMVYNSLTGLISTPTYIIDTDQKQVIFGDDTPAPTADETVCIYRNTPNVQDVAFRTLHGYDAQTLENILSKIVAMIQEIKSNYFSTQVLQGDPWQLDLLSSDDDGATVNIDYTAKKLVKGLYFRITSGNLQVSADGVTYLTMPKSDDVAEFRQYEQTLPDLTVIRKLQYRVGNQWFDAEANAQYTADEAYALAESVQTTMNAHINNTQNPHQTSVAKLTDVDIQNILPNQFLMFDGLKWTNVNSSVTASWGMIFGNIADQTDLKNALDAKVNLDGSLIMTAPLKFRAGSMRGAVGPYLNGVSFWKMDSQENITNIANLTDSQFLPVSTNSIDLGRSANKWKDLYLAGKLFVATLNNGADLTVPNKSGTLATTADVELAANSGSQLYSTGVWYAKMYAATTVPTGAEYDGTNYADFSQVDADNNPVIKIYTGASGAWTLTDTITPPAEYNGYIWVTSKIWDIAEQTDQQGGQVLWDHTHKTFTPYPKIVSVVTSLASLTDVTLNSPSANQVLTYNGTSWTNQSITFPTINYSINGGNYTAGTGSYAITRFSLMLQKADGTWEKPTDTSVTYSQATNKTVNTNGFLLNQILYYNYTGTVSSGQLTGLNRVYSKHAFVPMSYSTNCGTAPGWALGTWIYLVGTLGADGLFYLDTTQWWSDALPNSADGKLYIRLGPASSGTSDTVVLLEDRPIFYHDGVEVKEYIVGVSNKADTDLSNVSQTGKSAAIGWLMPDYSQGQNVALTGITQWTAPIDCFVSYNSGLQNTAATELKIGNKRVAYFSNPFSGFVYTTVTFYMKAGQTLTGLSANDTNRDSIICYYPLGA